MPYANTRIAPLRRELHELIRAFEAVRYKREVREYERTIREIESLIMIAQRETKDDEKLALLLTRIGEALESLHNATLEQKTLHHYTQKQE